jgi:hypothetical protein
MYSQSIDTIIPQMTILVVLENQRLTTNIYHNEGYFCWLTPKGPKAFFRPFLKFGQAIVKAIFIKNS